MKNRIITNSFRLIKRSFPRFLSLLVISMLGVFCFAGLGATAPDMIKTLDNYLDSTNTYDIKIISTMGLVDDDIKALEKIDGISDVEGGYSLDLLVGDTDNEYVINVSSIPFNINKLKLIDGEFPNQNNEIVVEDAMLSNNDLKLGDEIYLNSDTFLEKKVRIVGTVDSSLYFNAVVSNSNRGSTSVGTGTINYYTFCLDSNFNQDYYTNIYLTVDSLKDLETSSDKYEEITSLITGKIESIKKDQEDSRYDKIYKNAEDEILKQQEEGESKLNEVKAELDLAKVELDSASYNLNIFKNGLDNTKVSLNEARASLDEAWNNYHNTLFQYSINENEIDDKILFISDNILKLEETIKTLAEVGLDTNEYEQQLLELNAFKQQLETIKGSKDSLLEKENEYKEGLNKYNDSYNTYISNLNTYNDNYQKYLQSVDQYNVERENFELKISEAFDKLEEIDRPVWYIYDRSDYLTYAEYIDDTNSIKNLGKMFPMVFFAVSILVSLISMNRMVEDDRGEIGTLKSLGFSNRHIMIKYLLFSFLAMFFGGIVGSLLGIVIIPSLIFKIYKILFDVPNFVMSLNLSTTLTGFIISFICVCGATIYTVRKVLKEKPSELMRPKAPKNGKRVFLEKIDFIWNNISFSNKVTIRNLFRYKKRVIVTIVGIAGCCGLMLCGFGIKDSITDISNAQYSDIFKFDGMAYVSNISDLRINEVFNDSRIESITKIESVKSKVEDVNVNLFVAEDNRSLSNIVNLVDTQSNKKVKLEKGKVIITEKLASLKKIDVGDYIEFIDINNKKYKYEVSSIVKNYFEHFIYIDKNTYEKNGDEFISNVIYLNTIKLSNKERDLLAKDLLKNDEVINVSYVSLLITAVCNMLNSLDEVIFILIVLASLLSFVVLYNLSNININERKREIATLKVLGFYNKEVDNYITKENIILTIIGIIFGLIFGYFLTNMIILTVEIEKARFLRKICFNSYLYSAVMSLIFTIIVNIVTHFSLKKIDMIESLKSVE